MPPRFAGLALDRERGEGAELGRSREKGQVALWFGTGHGVVWKQAGADGLYMADCGLVGRIRRPSLGVSKKLRLDLRPTTRSSI